MTPSILVNATERELENLGGDFSYLARLRELPVLGAHATLVRDSWWRAATMLRSKLLERACARFLPGALRSALLVASRRLHVGADEARGRVVFSHLLLPSTRGNSRGQALVWSTQGIAPERYYVYGGGHTQADVAALFARAASDCDVLIVWTEDGARRLRELVPVLSTPVCVIPAPVPVREPLASDALQRKRGCRLLFVGVDGERKGLRDVLAAMRGLVRRWPRISLDVVSRPRAELTRDLLRTPNVRWYRSAQGVDVAQLMADADVFVLPTHADTYALAAVEAMAYGCAVVISDLPPLPELFPDSLVGHTVPAGDPRHLEDALAAMLAHPERLRALQASARHLYLQRHAPAVVEPQLLAACEQAALVFQRHRETRLVQSACVA